MTRTASISSGPPGWRSGRRSRWRRRRRGRRGACGRPCPGGLRSCGSTSTRSVRPGASLSGFIARHIEQPGSRQSKPAATNTWSSPSASACAFTATEPGTTSVRTPGFTVPAARDVGRGAQVLDPRVRARTDEHGVDGDVAHRRARLQAHVRERALGRLARRLVGERVGVGDGVVDRDRLARVRAPRHVRTQRRARRSRLPCRTAAPSSVTSARQSSSARSQSAPFGANGRPSRYANVVSSGATSPARAPASIDMLHTVMRPSIDRRADRRRRGTRGPSRCRRRCRCGR